jgi:hypothetical protein
MISPRGPVMNLNRSLLTRTPDRSSGGVSFNEDAPIRIPAPLTFEEEKVRPHADNVKSSWREIR